MQQSAYSSVPTVLIVCVSKAYQFSRKCKRGNFSSAFENLHLPTVIFAEALYAKHLEKHVIPIIVENYRPSAWLDWVNADSFGRCMRSNEEVDKSIAALIAEIVKRATG